MLQWRHLDKLLIEAQTWVICQYSQSLSLSSTVSCSLKHQERSAVNSRFFIIFFLTIFILPKPSVPFDQPSTSPFPYASLEGEKSFLQ